VLEEQHFSIVMLDIWLRGMDGLEVLKRIKERFPALPVIMISGHATIATAIKATRMGASEFIEKPLDLEATVGAVRRIISEHTHSELDLKHENDAETHSGVQVSAFEIAGDLHAELNRIAFAGQRLAGRRVAQRTLASSIVLYGQGLHSGVKSGLILEPLPPNSGIHFIGMSDPIAVPAHVDFVESTGYATMLKFGATQAATIEHLMSALHAFGISNLLVKCNGEVPVFDGSARDFCQLFETTGFEEQSGDWYEIEVKKIYRVGNSKEFIQIEPADEFSITYTLDYPEPVGRQQMHYSPLSAQTFKRDIAAARTFGFVKDIGALQSAGLALGGRFDNFVLIGSDGAVNTELRYPDEMVRHKILDAIGDLYLLGRPLRGKVTASMTGHSDNIALLREIRKDL
ncbi:MAG: UDP-3-O-[3-hydroxymyristoyl] N-acetylglucosamine deacetylase, partial [Bdellovibrionales bacterium]|nr:UDP-3-O-[3-hydroxymyristoyl] N-acetylglucosamine deacetylase [Bdellovibrionales bacterium]